MKIEGDPVYLPNGSEFIICPMKLNGLLILLGLAFLTAGASDQQSFQDISLLDSARYSQRTSSGRLPLFSPRSGFSGKTKKLETRYFSVTLPVSSNYSGLARKIAGSEKWWKQYNLIEELDTLYQKVLETTDLYKPASDKIVLEFKEELSQGPAVYLYGKRAICIRLKDVTREIIIHEMAHAALHTYSGIKLPRAIDETMALWTVNQLE